MTPMPTAMISESMRPSRSRPGLRRRTSIRMPAMRHGYTDRYATSPIDGNGNAVPKNLS